MSAARRWYRDWRAWRNRIGVVTSYSGCHSTVTVQLNDGTQLTCMTYDERRPDGSRALAASSREAPKA